MKGIFSISTDNNWWKGEISMRYNLLTVAKCLTIIIALAVSLAVLYGIWQLLKLLWLGLCWCGGATWTGIVWLSQQWIYLLILGGTVLAIFLLRKIDKKKLSNYWKKHSKILWGLLGLLLLVGISILTIKTCSSSNEELAIVEVVEEEKSPQEKCFNEAFDWVVTTRAYLDGVQNGISEKKRALIGLKYVNGKSVEKMDFSDKTYEEAVEIVSSEWRTMIVQSLGEVQLNEQQMVALTLFAMRNGKYGYLNSSFLKEVKKGNMEASNLMLLHKADGTERKLRTEALQYLWVIKNIWDGNISVKNILDYPMFSYKRIDIKEMYNDAGHLWNTDLEQKLVQGDAETPRVALGL